MTAASLQVPDAIRPILEWWLARVLDCLGERVQSVVLFGSVALGDFCPGWSDVDVCTVVDRPVTQAEGRSLGLLHDEMRGRFIDGGADGWRSGQAIEGAYVPWQMVADADCRMPCYTAGGTTRRWAVEHPVTPYDRLLLARCGRPVHGSDVRFSAPSREALVAQTVGDLASVRREGAVDMSSIWLCGIQHWLARSLVFWRDEELLSKSAALRKEIEAGSPYAEAFSLVLQIRQEGSAAANRHRDALQRSFRRWAAACAEEIESHVRG